MPRSTLPRNVLALSLVSLLTDVSSEMIYPLVPTFLATVLGAGVMSVGAIEGAAESVSALLKYASGWWSDRAGRRKPLVVAGYALASAVRPLIGLAQVVGEVFAVRIIDRFGKGIRTAPRDALIADSVAPAERGRAFGFHRAADHLGAVIGPLVAFALLGQGGVTLRGLFLLAAVPAAVAMVVLVVGVREGGGAAKGVMGGGAGGDSFPVGGPPRAPTPGENDTLPGERSTEKGRVPAPPLGRRFYTYIGVLLLFTLGNSTDAFLLLRAHDLGVATAAIPLLWSALHVVKALSSMPAGQLSDRLGRRPLIIAGWAVFAGVYLGFARATMPWHVWALFLAYGLFFGLTEGAEKALVADLVPPHARGRAFGWFNLAIATGALPAALFFGFVWQRWGAPAAFTVGAGVAAAASLALLLLLPGRRLQG